MNVKDLIEQVADGADPKQVIRERRRVPAAGGYGSDEPLGRPGAFKVSQGALDMVAADGPNIKSKTRKWGSPDDLLFKKVRDFIEGIPRESLPALFGADNMSDAQDVIAGKPKQAFQGFLRRAGKLQPKLANYFRKTPENVSLVYYAIMVRVSGRMMADQIFKRYFSTDQYYKPRR